MQAIGLCRFSYPAIGGFQVGHDTPEERMAYLFDPPRIEERFRLFEAITLPALKAQTDPDFDLLIVIGDLMPDIHRQRLEALVGDMHQVQIIDQPPRPQREVMKEVLNSARRDPKAPCVQFRMDDDDAVAVDFIARLRQAVADTPALVAQHRIMAFDWNKGYLIRSDATGIQAQAICKPCDVAALATHIRGGNKQTIMNFAHHKIPQFMPVLSNHEGPMFLRSHNAYNDSRQKPVKQSQLEPLTQEEEALFRERFAVDVDTVRAIFSR